ncbi:MAG: spondin domain-containing protein [Ilumatobacter sp.]
MRNKITAAALATATIGTTLAVGGGVDATDGFEPARIFEVTVQVTNNAPAGGTFQTPTWVAVHDGSFDLYDRDAPVSPELERLAEDGAIGPLAALFAGSGAGQDAIAFGPNGPIAPGDTGTVSFLVEVPRGQEQFFSYASMVLPSNDAFVANGNPEAHQIVDERGRITPVEFTVAGSEVLDAGSEVNDELPETTAFFGQAAPDTGVVENGNVVLHPGFNEPADGNILGSDMFGNGDFTAVGYETLSFSVDAERVDVRSFSELSPANQVPALVPSETTASGDTRVRLQADGDIDWRIRAERIDDVLFAHIHLGAPGENGPVVATLFNGDPAPNSGQLRVNGEISADDLVGPLAGSSTLDLWAEIEAGNAYINVHSAEFPGGELRSNL